MTLAELRAVLRADFARNDYRSSRIVLAIFRFGGYARAQPPVARAILVRIYKVLNSVIVRTVYQLAIDSQMQCGPGLRLVHAARGAVIHPHVRIGANVTLYHRVTLGEGGGHHARRLPRVGDKVVIGPGACVFGDIDIGDGARIGANAVVVRDVAAGARAFGIPAHRNETGQ